MGMGGVSNGRIWAIAAIVACATIVAVGVGLGLGLGKDKNDVKPEEKQTTKFPGTFTASPLYVSPSPSKEERYRFAAVAADAEVCSKIGNHVMAVQGGSVIDAAIAAILCLGVYNAHSCGIGGGHFLTFYERSTGRVYIVDAREQAPANATRDMFAIGNNASSTVGGKAIAIPGEIRGLYKAYRLGGRLPWKQLFQPAIDLCRNGFKVGKSLSANMKEHKAIYDKFPLFKQLITNPNTDQLYNDGEIMKRPVLAKTLEVLADDPDAFYNGGLAENISADIQDAGGIVTKDDLANYTVLVKDPLMLHLRDNLTVYSPPPPSSGAVYLFILNVLNGYSFSADSVADVNNSIITWHRITEAFKHAYSLRAELGDSSVGTPEFRSYINALLKNMTDPIFGEDKRRLINDTTTFGSSYYNPQFFTHLDHGTSHLSVLGPNGDAVSITGTLNMAFGSKVVGSRTGIIFNNEMDDFSIPGTVNNFGVVASPANFIEPWKRPMSSICPSIVVGPDSNVVMVVGASGGTKITSATALVTIETLWFKWNIKEAIDFPRIHHQLFPQEVAVQSGFPQIVIDGLKERGHNLSTIIGIGSVVQGILKQGDYIAANSDYRKYGAPDGY